MKKNIEKENYNMEIFLTILIIFLIVSTYLTQFITDYEVTQFILQFEPKSAMQSSSFRSG